jgi:DNA-binding transcriptional LysR family regulator
MYPGVELRLLRYVVAVAEELHFSRAAAKVRVAQPSLSKQIRDLEEEIGTRLFDRTNREVRLTAAGRVFVREAEKALAHSDRAVQLARQADPAKDGELRIGYTPRMNLGLLSAIRRLFSDSRTAKATFQSLATTEQVNALLEGSLEVGIVSMPLHHPSLTFELLLREPLVAALSETIPANGTSLLTLPQLAGVPLICRARRLNSQSHDYLLKVLRKSGYTPPSVVEVTNDMEAMHMVCEGLGVSFVKASVVPFHGDNIPIFRKTDVDLFEDTAIAYRRSNRAKPLRKFVEMMRRDKRNLALHSLGPLGNESLDDQSDTIQLKLF